jgi:glutamine phosphoribosylpyrophosphate amidotransferase
MKKIPKTYTVREDLAIKLELVSRLLKKTRSVIVNDLIEKGLTSEAIIEEVRTSEAEKKIFEAQLKLLEK